MTVRPLPEEPQARREVKASRRADTSGRKRAGQDRPTRPIRLARPTPALRQTRRTRLARQAARNRQVGPTRLTRLRRHWWIEVLIVLAGYQIYEWTRGVAPNHPGMARRNGLAIWHAEQWLHLDPEPWLNHALEAVPPLAALAGYYYLALNFFVPIGLLIWLYLRRPADYGPLRWVLGVVTMSSLVCFWLLPVSPPRFVVTGMMDTVATSHLIGAAYQGEIAPHANLYAAMPSLHVAWAGWCAVVALRACRRAWVRAVFCAYPALTTVDILATSNHYLADALGGALLLGLACGTVALVALVRAPRSGTPPPDPVSIRKR
ncbi:MAG TPA: phosphatase PAP2 family protein [Mycobacteriales bacterium]|nr:phosphatase PAP2 family protein [Mycobacteriales bacterium]